MYNLFLKRKVIARKAQISQFNLYNVHSFIVYGQDLNFSKSEPDRYCWISPVQNAWTFQDKVLKFRFIPGYIWPTQPPHKPLKRLYPFTTVLGVAAF